VKYEYTHSLSVALFDKLGDVYSVSSSSKSFFTYLCLCVCMQNTHIYHLNSIEYIAHTSIILRHERLLSNTYQMKLLSRRQERSSPISPAGYEQDNSNVCVHPERQPCLKKEQHAVVTKRLFASACACQQHILFFKFFLLTLIVGLGSNKHFSIYHFPEYNTQQHTPRCVCFISRGFFPPLPK